ncbi:MAG: TonB-dependent receptor [Flavobacteriales bacterium]
MRKILSIVLLFASFSISLSQSVSGVVKDEKTKEPLIGVNVILSNTNGTTTNINGEFNVEVKNGENTITFKYIGYETIVKDIAGKSKFDIKMKSVSQQIGTVVISAGKFEQKIEEITVSMEVISPSLIENKNTTDIQTVMEQVPGVNITDGQANIRGGSGWSYGAGSRVLVMVDDMPLISGDAGQVQWKLIATENINQIEVIKGASSVLYGSSALNGVINIRTAFPKKTEIDKHTSAGYTKITTHFGVTDHAKRDVLNWWGDRRQQYYGTEFSHSRKIGNLDLTVGGNYFQDEGYRKDEITDRKRFNFNTNYHSKKLSGLSYGINGNFLFQSTGSAIIWNGFDQAYIPLNNEITTTNGDTYNVDPFIQYINENNRHSFRTRYLKVVNDNSTNGLDDNQDNESEIFYTDYQWQHNYKPMSLRITSGTTNELVLARSDLFNGNNSRKNHAIYTQIDKKWDKVNLSFGGRYEHFTIQSDEQYFINGDSTNSFIQSKPVFRAGLNYQVAEATYLRTSWGQGFRFPSMAELFISANHSGLEIYPNPELKAESGWSTEIGIKQGMKIKNWMGYIDVAAFLMRYDDMMEFSFGQWGGPENPLGGIGFKSINVGATQISGVELSISGQGEISPDLTINVISGYTFMNPISLNPDAVYGYGINHGDTLNNGTIIDQSITYTNSSSDPSMLKYRYKHIAKIDVEVVYKEISLGGSARYNSFMHNIDTIFTTAAIAGIIPGINESRGDNPNTDIIETHGKGDFIVDLRAGYQMNTIVRLGIIVNNLFNVEHITRPANMMPPRTIAIQCNMKI